MLSPQYRLDRILKTAPSLWFSALFLIVLFVTARQFWLLHRARRSLALGDQPKTRVRRLRPPYVLLVLLFWGFESFISIQDAPVYRSADLATQNWPSLVQLEETGALQGEQLVIDRAYLQSNRSPLAPVQESWFETGSKLWRGAEFHTRLSAHYIQTRSPALAAKVFQGMADEKDRDLVQYSDFGTPSALAVRSYTGFSPMDRPELDQLSAARFQRGYQDGFCFIARRGDQVLCVDYSGFGDLDACLDLYLNTLLTET